jgi:predicted alpha-1,2-mannosidase
MMPFTGEVKWDPKDYRSGFSHAREKASPGFYQVQLDKYRINVKLSTTTRAGMHQYDFPADAKDGSVMIDLTWRDELLDADLRQISPYELTGVRKSRSWAQNQTVYFVIRFNQPIKNFEARQSQSALSDHMKLPAGKNIKGYVLFDLEKTKTIHVKVGISAVSEDGARKNLDKEITGWNFNKLQQDAKKAWNKELSKIEVRGGTKNQQIVFYTALYHSFLVPNIFQDVDGQFRGTDDRIHAANQFNNYSVFSLWDTYRAYHPLMTIINKRKTVDWINTFLHQYKYGGMLPVWELSANETFCMIGYHSIPVIVDAYQKGIRGFDTKLALEAMRSYADSDRFGLKHYRKNGYISNEKEHESVSKTLEYAYDDWCIAEFAKMTGNDSVYKNYITRAQFYKNVFDPSTKHMRGKVEARWYQPFDPTEINNFFTEGNSWHYSFAVPQDISGLMKLHGGVDSFYSKLVELFTTSSLTTGRQQADVTGLIGQYAQGNEPSHHMAYLFNYTGRPWKTQELIKKICSEFYTNAPDGLIGNEDCGQMSAWYVLSAMGFYPVCPGSGEYALGIPLFDEVVLHLENGKKFTIRANQQEGNNYVRATKLNGKKSTTSFLSHTCLEKDGELEFVLGKQPDLTWGTGSNDLPRSSIIQELIVPAPYFSVSSNKFRDSLWVSIMNIDPNASIYYTLKDEDGRKITKPYSKPFLIKKKCLVEAVGKKGNVASLPVSQQFYQLPTDYKIKVLSKVHPMYTAGGEDALIDGIQGNTNWRAGEWQSYFDQDFEAMIDLQKDTMISFVGIHVLQDISPWIVFPKELILFTSDDGIHFSEAGRVMNNIKPEIGKVQLQELGIKKNLKTRYIKVKAVNGGKLPAWHESAGEGSHLFIDEVIIK